MERLIYLVYCDDEVLFAHESLKRACDFVHRYSRSSDLLGCTLNVKPVTLFYGRNGKKR